MACKGSTFFVLLQTIMEKPIKILTFILIALLSVCMMVACQSDRKQAQKVQQTLIHQQRHALEVQDKLNHLLDGNSFDSIRALGEQEKEFVLLILVDQELVYWSQNWLTILPTRPKLDTWWYAEFANAHCVGRWHLHDNYLVGVIIPFKYCFHVPSDQLPDEFLPPFKGDEELEVTGRQTGSNYPIFSDDGSYLFSLGRPETKQKVDGTDAPDSFSYRSILASNKRNEDEGAKDFTKSSQFLIVLTIIIFVLIILIGIYGLIHARGFRNMKIGTKFQYALVALVLGGFIYIFFMSIQFVRSRYEQRQQVALQHRARYIQSSLRELYFWDLRLSSANSPGLNADLKDMSFTYENDIHVYDLHGNLIGTSVPELLNRGIISPKIAPEPFFSGKPTYTDYEYLGTTRYLATYTLLYNGNYVPIGYIAVPSYISDDQMNREISMYLARLLPPYLVVLLLCFVIAFVVARGLTAPLINLGDKMRHFRLGETDNHLDYPTHDEVGELVHHYNEMVDKLEQSTLHLAKAEREAAWKTMARQAAHEINNALTPMKLTIQMLQRTKEKEDFEERFDRSTGLLIDQIDDLGRIASSFSGFAKMPEVHAVPTDIAARLMSVVTLLRHNADEVPVRYIGPDMGVMAIADQSQVGEVFSNIIKNALQALQNREGGDIIVMLKGVTEDIRMHRELPEGEWVEVSISDNGPGIPEDVQSKIFMPNFTTKSTGMGLGLAISKNIIDQSGGKICFETYEKGTTFFVYFRKL